MFRNISNKFWQLSQLQSGFPASMYVRMMSGRKRILRRKFLELDKDPTGGFLFGEELDNIEGIAGADQVDMHQQMVNHSEKNKSKILRKIIERKHFKPEQEVNLLTWDAKEQIRYLHQEFPDVWTIDKLSESFPISRSGVINILKSKWQPTNMKELLRHDKSVHRNWKMLKDAGQENLASGPIYSRYEQLLTEGKLKLLAHADGIPSLPHPDNKIKFLIDAEKTHVKTDGPFASIVKDYCLNEGREVNEVLQMNPDSRRELKKLQSRSKSLIVDTVQSSLEQKGSVSDFRAVQSELEESLKAERKKTESIRENRKTASSITEASLLDVDLIPPYVAHPAKLKQDQFQMNAQTKVIDERKEITNYKGNGDKGLEGTGKIVDIAVGEEVSRIIEKGEKKKKFAVSRLETEIADSIHYDEEAYIYTPEKGYEYPLGRRSDIEPYIDIDDSMTEGKLYQRGKDIYDENGEFLYRIP